MDINKNISVWRGDNAPPTNYHFWIKADGSQFVYTGKDWTDYRGFIPSASSSQDGLMSKEDKEKLDTLNSTTLYKYRGSLKTIDSLPTNPELGDTYNIVTEFIFESHRYPAGTNISWNGKNWDPLGGVVEFDEIYSEINKTNSTVSSLSTHVDEADNDIKESITNLSNVAQNQITAINTSITNLTSDYKSADKSLGTRIDDKVNNVNIQQLAGQLNVIKEGVTTTYNIDAIRSTSYSNSTSLKVPSTFKNYTTSSDLEYVYSSNNKSYNLITSIIVKANTEVGSWRLAYSKNEEDTNNNRLLFYKANSSSWSDAIALIDSKNFNDYFTPSFEDAMSEMEWQIFE